MRKRPLGKSGIEASVVGLGTWAIGGWMWGGIDEADAIFAIHAAFDAGINLIDTAPIYGFGLSEQIVGKALADRRDRAVIATKCGLITDPSRGTLFFRSTAAGNDSNGAIAVHRCLTPASIRAEVEQSLIRLKTDYIDLYQTHWQDTTTPIEATMETLLSLKRAGKIRAIGVSNATASQMGEYARYGQLDSDQEKYSMIDRKIEKDQLLYTRKNNLSLLAYSPLALGLLTGKISTQRNFNAGDLRRTNPRFQPEHLSRLAHAIDRLKPLCEEMDATVAQLVIAWTLHQPGITHALVGARSRAHAIQNAAAGALELSAIQYDTLNDMATDLANSPLAMATH